MGARVVGGEAPGRADRPVVSNNTCAPRDTSSTLPVLTVYVSVLTTSTVTRLNQLEPGSRFDVRRFRMNVIVDSGDDGFVENGWIGQGLTIGGTVRLNVAMPDPRCVMTTLAQDDLPGDTEVLRALVRHNRLDLGPIGQYPCAGVYAVVGTPGTIRAGDRVSIA